MNGYQRILTTLSLAAAVAACMPHPEVVDPSAPVNLDELKVADAFTFRSTRDILLNVKVANPAFAGEQFRINVYDDFPTIGNRITSGLTDANQSLRLEFRTAAPQNFLYVEKVDPFGASEVLKVPAASYASADFKQATPVLSLRTAAQSGLDCSSGLTRVIKDPSGWIDIKRGEVVGIMGKFSNGGINMNDGGTVRFCGTVENVSISMNHEACRVYFLEGSTITLSGLNINNRGAKVYNYSDKLSFTGSASWGGYVENNGKVKIEGDLNLNEGGTLLNNGELTVGSNLNNDYSLTNNHTITVKNSYQANGKSTNLNACKLVVGNEFILNAPFTNRSYVKANQRTTVNGGGMLTLENGALLSTKDMMMNNKIEATGKSKSVVKVTGNSTFNGGSSLAGPLVYCDENGVETNWGGVSKAFFTCQDAYLPTSSCNAEGFGKPVIQDADGDGVADAQDEFPNDPTRAFTGANYPSATGYATYGFEDLWPAKGDYDFNDLVVNFRITKDLNASNKVVSMRYKLKVRAVGASFDNGFGFQLDDVASGDIASVTGMSLKKGLVNLNGNGTESGQSKAVIIAFDSPEPLIKRTTGSGFNVIKTNPTGTSTELELVVVFKTPMEQSKLAQSKINPFIFANGKRDQEIHLCNFAPTAKANGGLFNTQHDKSNSGQGRYYRTANGLPWGLEIPIEFSYPIEKAPITEAYGHFTEWAKSGGTQYPDWYLNKGGYVSAEKIY